MSNGSDLIAAERARQISKEGRTPEHDAEHLASELARGALCYINAATHADRGVPDKWPWDESYWKPDTEMRMLEKGGALIAAEIDRRIAQGEQ